VELELKDGAPEFLYEAAETMISAIDARLCLISKGSYGYRLAGGYTAEPEHSLDLRFDHDPSIESAFQTIADACLRQYSINEECLRAGIEPEAIHQARVAIRRLRAAFSMFKGIVAGDDADNIRKELKWLSDLLGKARDLDVFVDSQLMVIKLEHPGVPGLEELVQSVESMRNDSHNQLQEAIHSHKLRQLILSAVRCVHNGEWMLSDESAISRETPFLDFAKSELDRRFGSVRKNKKAVRGHDALKRHRVRIKAKKLRYMAEFLKTLAPGRAFSQTSKKLKRLQDLLGALNDQIAEERLLGQVAQEARKPAVTFAADLIRQYDTIAGDVAKKRHNRDNGRRAIKTPKMEGIGYAASDIRRGKHIHSAMRRRHCACYRRRAKRRLAYGHRHRLGLYRVRTGRARAPAAKRAAMVRYAAPGIIGTLAISAAMNSFAFGAHADILLIYPAIRLGLAIPALILCFGEACRGAMDQAPRGGSDDLGCPPQIG
jgi:CHAD domain-containing protein